MSRLASILSVSLAIVSNWVTNSFGGVRKGIKKDRRKRNSAARLTERGQYVELERLLKAMVRGRQLFRSIVDSAAETGHISDSDFVTATGLLLLQINTINAGTRLGAIGHITVQQVRRALANRHMEGGRERFAVLVDEGKNVEIFGPDGVLVMTGESGDETGTMVEEYLNVLRPLVKPRSNRFIVNSQGQDREDTLHYAIRKALW